jgi:hypothetical protein
MTTLVELRILPPFAIARLGSSAEPMDNYEVNVTTPIGWRQIADATTFVVDAQTCEIHAKTRPFVVKFRDESGKIRPVAPFLEVWVRLDRSDDFVPLTLNLLRELGQQPSAVKWSVVTGNNKAFRRTGDPRDKVIAATGVFSDHQVKPLLGKCKNFFDGKSILLGSVQYIKPNEEFPEVRLRFTPAAGKVYGPPLDSGRPDGNLADEVYDPSKGQWKGYQDAADPKTDDILKMRRATNPGNVYAGDDYDASHRKSWGYLDDECDGIVEVELQVGSARLSSFARIAAGPPTFAPDSMPIRTVHDELEQAMLGPDFDAEVTDRELEEVREIVRRALETVRLMNTGQMNKPSKQRGVGMARMDFLDVNRALEPIVDPAVADSLATRSRHERLLIALDSGSLAWFARVLREYDQVGDLSTDGRRKMPALMRGADARYLALTRRQVSKIKAAAEFILRTPAKENER